MRSALVDRHGDGGSVIRRGDVPEQFVAAFVLDAAQMIVVLAGLFGRGDLGFGDAYVAGGLRRRDGEKERGKGEHPKSRRSHLISPFRSSPARPWILASRST